MTAARTDTAPYLAAFHADPQEPAWLRRQRADALARFEALGFPTRREEAWRFTDLRPLQRGHFPPAAAGGRAEAAELERWRLAEPTHRLVLVNGRFAPELSQIGKLPPGAWLASSARTLAERPELLRSLFDATDAAGGQAFAALNAALFADGFVLALEDGVALDRPVEVIHLGMGDASVSFHLRSAVLLGAGSRLRLCESFAGSGPTWTNAVTLLQLGAAAVLDHVRLQDEGREALHFAVLRGSLARAARYAGFTLALGARLARQDVFLRLAGEAARVMLDGVTLLDGEREATMVTVVEHAAPGGATRELFKSVVDDQAHGAFLGRIAVRPEAQQTDAHQLSRNLLLSPRAAVDTKPELEILADDVKCSHGATVGDLDEAALFYLQARGIPEARARRMLIEGFVKEALERIGDETLRRYLARHVGGRLDAGGGP